MAERRIVILLLSCLLWGRESVEAGSFGWPLSIKPALSSTFGETRSTAFHAGIDVKTWGRTGYEVQALGDGYVWRLRTSPWGYGRVVYQKLADGRILVYAHLGGFAPKLSARIEEAQRQQQQYSVDLWFQEGELPVKRGELIAWTGSSGAGPPHLHMELRDADNLPVNPLLHGFEVQDSTAPTLRRVALVPVERESLVKGGHEPISVGLRWEATRGLFETGKVLSVYGRIGVSVLGYDRADAAPNKLAPLRTTLSVDGRRVFAARYDRFSYSDAHQMSLDRTRLDFGDHSGNFFNLFRRPGNRLGFYESGEGDGYLACGTGGEDGFFLDKGVHLVEVESEDAAGNSSLARFQVRVNAPPSIVDARIVEGVLEFGVRDADDARLEVELARSQDGKEWKAVEKKKVKGDSIALKWRLDGEAPLWRVRVRDEIGGESFRICALPAEESATPRLTVEQKAHRDFAELTIRADRVLAGAPRVRVADRRLVVRQTGLWEYAVDVPLKSGGTEVLEVQVEGRGRGGASLQELVHLNQRAAAPGEESRLIFGEGEAELVFAEKSAYEIIFPQGERFRPGDTEDLASSGIGYVFGPFSVSFDLKVAVRLRYPEEFADPEKLGIYQDSGDGEWRMVGNELDVERRMVGAMVRQFSRFALMADEEPPVIGELHPRSGAVLEIRRPRLSAWIDDGGSGIGREEDVVMELDGRKLISEYDPDEKKVEYLVRKDLQPGAHQLLVRVRDMSGNEASARAEFTVE